MSSALRHWRNVLETALRKIDAEVVVNMQLASLEDGSRIGVGLLKNSALSGMTRTSVTVTGYRNRDRGRGHPGDPCENSILDKMRPEGVV